MSADRATDVATEVVQSFLESGVFDIADPGYVQDPFPHWAEARGCPVHATSERGGLHLVIGYDAILEAASSVPTLSSARGTSVFPTLEDRTEPGYPRSIISSDPPVHTPIRRTMLPTFGPKAVQEYEPITKGLCNRYLDELGDRTHVDAAVEYAQRIPARVIGLILGVDESMTDTFVQWVRDILENVAVNPQRRLEAGIEMAMFFTEQIESRKANPTDDFTTQLMQTRTENGEPLETRDILGNLALLLIAGIDTTWSAIGSSLWHLAQHPEQCHQLRDDPELWPQAVEELLRAYAPVSMGRIATEDTEIAGCPVASGSRVVLAFPAANRDPLAFPNPDVVDFTRSINRHVAFGAGIHRCAGSNIARMELRVALQTWLERFPNFSLDADGLTTWAGGQVRGPRHVPVVLARPAL
jgi:cytochrome P450